MILSDLAKNFFFFTKQKILPNDATQADGLKNWKKWQPFLAHFVHPHSIKASR